jgi:hypothetical protein
MKIRIGYMCIASALLICSNAYAVKFSLRLWSAPDPDVVGIAFIENNVSAIHDRNEFFIKEVQLKKPISDANWDLLQMSPTPDMEAVKKKYYALARAVHPDRNQENAARMAQLTEAYKKIIAKPSCEVVFKVEGLKKEVPLERPESVIECIVDKSFDEIKSELIKKKKRILKDLLFEAGWSITMDTNNDEGREVYSFFKDLIKPCDMVLQDIPPLPAKISWSDSVKRNWHYILGAIGIAGAGYAAYRYYQTK